MKGPAGPGQNARDLFVEYGIGEYLGGIYGVRIRQLNAEDFFALLEYDWSPLVAERDTIYLVLARDHGRCGFVAEDDSGAPVGYVLGARSSDGKSIFLFHVHVKKRNRHEGVGSALVRELERVAAESGVERIWLLAGDRVAGFYTALGYAPCSDIVPAEVAEYVVRRKAARVLAKGL